MPKNQLGFSGILALYTEINTKHLQKRCRRTAAPAFFTSLICHFNGFYPGTQNQIAQIGIIYKRALG